MIVTLRAVASLAGLTTLLVTACAWAQETQRPALDQPTRQADLERSALVAPLGSPITAYPVELLGLLAARTQRGPLTLVPSISVSEEFNDNIFSNNNDRQWDFITGFSPAVTLFVNQPNYELTAGYSFTAEIWAKESDRSGPLNRQSFVGNGLFRVSPGLTFGVSDTFLYDRNENVSSVGPSGQQQSSWTNTFTPSMSWQMTPNSSLRLGASYSALRYFDQGSGFDSDTYTFQGTLGYAFTGRLAGSLGYGFTYLEEEQDNSFTHTPTLGLSYRLTPTLTATIAGGPAITTIRGTTNVSPAGSASLTQAFQWGALAVQYNRGVSAAGGFGGTNDTQTVSGTLTVLALRGLSLAFSPTYTTSESLGNQQGRQVDVQTFTLGLSALYQIARYVAVFAGYTFLHERTGGSSSTQADVDQNTVRIGLQFGYPINFD